MKEEYVIETGPYSFFTEFETLNSGNTLVKGTDKLTEAKVFTNFKKALKVKRKCEINLNENYNPKVMPNNKKFTTRFQKNPFNYK